MARFVCSPLTGDLCEVPGVSANVQSVFHEHGIQTSFQLIEKYASLKEDGMGVLEQRDRFLSWIAALHMPLTLRAKIARAIADITAISSASGAQNDDDDDGFLLV
eukprot:gene23868-28898_t